MCIDTCVLYRDTCVRVHKKGAEFTRCRCTAITCCNGCAASPANAVAKCTECSRHTGWVARIGIRVNTEVTHVRCVEWDKEERVSPDHRVIESAVVVAFFIRDILCGPSGSFVRSSKGSVIVCLKLRLNETDPLGRDTSIFQADSVMGRDMRVFVRIRRDLGI
jgi:hypothetical protein